MPRYEPVEKYAAQGAKVRSDASPSRQFENVWPDTGNRDEYGAFYVTVLGY